MSVHLVTGHAGQGHITSADAGLYNAGLVGDEYVVLNTGTNFECSIGDANTLIIGSGDLVMQGRHISIPSGEDVELSINNCSESKSRIDTIVMRYLKDAETGIESAELAVVRGTEVVSGESPEPPELTHGNIFSGASVDEMPLYNITISSMIISEISALFSPLISLSAIENIVTSHERKLAVDDWHYLSNEDLKDGFKVGDDTAASLVQYLRYKKVNGIVYIQGSIICPESGIVGYSTAFYLPPEYAPSETVTFTATNLFNGKFLQFYIAQSLAENGKACFVTYMIKTFSESTIGKFSGQTFDINISYPAD